MAGFLHGNGRVQSQSSLGISGTDPRTVVIKAGLLGGDQGLGGFGRGGASRQFSIVAYEDDTYGLETGGAGDITHTATIESIGNNQWHFAYYDGTTMGYRVDGVTQTLTTTLNSIDEVFVLGMVAEREAGVNIDQPCVGVVEFAAVFTRALSSDEMLFYESDGASGTDPGSTGLILEWLFNDGSGTTVADSSSSGNDGVISLVDAADFWAVPAVGGSGGGGSFDPLGGGLIV